MSVESVTEAQAFTLKTKMLPITLFQIKAFMVDDIEQQLKAMIAKAPKLFDNMSVVIDMSQYATIPTTEMFEALASTLKRHHLSLVGVTKATSLQYECARNAGIPVLPNLISQTPSQESAPQPKRIEKPKPRTRVVEGNVRSGQHIYAEQGDLVVLGSVSPGAEVLADGNIFVYGALRGKALAGVQGHTEARIFCQALQAELVSIAGKFKLLDQLPGEFLNGPCHIATHEGILVFAKL